MNNYHVHPVANEYCQTGENPLWDPQHRILYWEDIPNGYIFRYIPSTKKWDKIYDGPTVGGFTLQENGKLLLFRDHDIALLHDDGGVQILTRDIDTNTGRFNDVIADPEGRVFAGTMGQGDKTSGGLYLVETDASVTKLWGGTGCANGMGFSPDLSKFYWTDSTARIIYVFKYDRRTGALTNRTEFYVAPEGVGTPDGMTVDVKGHVWSAHWDGFGIYHLDENGKVLEKIKFPVGQVSSAAFGGNDFDELYVTTAGGCARKGEPLGETTEDGCLFRVPVGVRGVPDFRSKINL